MPRSLSGTSTVGEIDGYKGLFAKASEHEDPSRRYQARVTLIEQGLSAAGQAPAARGSQASSPPSPRSALDVLTEEPREPVLLNYAGVALYELWSLDAARALFQAALRLDPSLPHVRGNLDEIRRRRKAAGAPQSAQGDARSRSTALGRSRQEDRRHAHSRPAG